MSLSLTIDPQGACGDAPELQGATGVEELFHTQCSLNTSPSAPVSPFCMAASLDLVKAFEGKPGVVLPAAGSPVQDPCAHEGTCRVDAEHGDAHGCSKPCLSDGTTFTLSTALTSVAPVGACQQGQQCIAHGVKAVCGKRPKMEDAFSVQTNFIDVPLSPADGVPNKLPARIAVQVGEQLEQTLAVSPVGSVPLSPGSAGGAPSFSTDQEQQSYASSSSSSSSDSGVCDTLHFFGVYDGHGGTEAAQHCATRLHHHLSKALAAVGSAAVHPLHPPDALCMAGGSGVQCQAEWTLCHGGGDQLDIPEGSPPNACTEKHGLADAADALKSQHELEPSAFNDNASSGSGADSRSDAPSITLLLEDALKEAFLRTDEEFAADGSAAMVGSTAVVALVGSKKMWLANCGDSRAVLSRGGKAIQLTDDHKPEREDEAARVEKAGGQVLFWNGHRVMGVLAMSRAIGDHGLRPYVIPEPEITVLSRADEDDFLLLASDGLWDVMANQEAINLAMRCLGRALEKGATRKAAVRIAASVLTKAALDRGSKDNVTVVIVDLKAPQPVAANGAAAEVGEGCVEACSAPCSAEPCMPCAQLVQQDTIVAGTMGGCC